VRDKAVLRKQLQAERLALLRPAGDQPRDQAAALPCLVPRLPDGGGRLRHPQAEGHRGVPALQLLLVPCVGFGPRGVRLGYGGGFYDRTLAAISRGR
jgi:hypothetical protein